MLEVDFTIVASPNKEYVGRTFGILEISRRPPAHARGWLLDSWMCVDFDYHYGPALLHNAEYGYVMAAPYSALTPRRIVSRKAVRVALLPLYDPEDRGAGCIVACKPEVVGKEAVEWFGLTPTA